MPKRNQKELMSSSYRVLIRGLGRRLVTRR